jgi:DNA-binding response OmpR family regulator
MKKPPGTETANQVVLSVGPYDEGCASLKRILKSDWTVTASATPAAALSLLRERRIPIVICDCDPTPGAWREMLHRISLLADPPLLILTSRLADERLWAESLNLGAWDVLPKPFQAGEAVRIVAAAWQHWQSRHDVYRRSTRQWGADAEIGQMTATGT